MIQDTIGLLSRKGLERSNPPPLGALYKINVRWLKEGQSDTLLVHTMATQGPWSRSELLHELKDPFSVHQLSNQQVPFMKKVLA